MGVLAVTEVLGLEEIEREAGREGRLTRGGLEAAVGVQ